tara:strand:- start:1811 stop:2047 length:237 start_codon:yes stop_codon:yes gene_type:complete
MRGLRESLIELIRRTSADIIEKNIELAKRKSQPLCQDTGSILFYVDCPVGLNQVEFEAEAREAVLEATKIGYNLIQRS